mgnify:CR=1 FL=1
MLKKIDWYKVVGLCLLAWIGFTMASIENDLTQITKKGVKVLGIDNGVMEVNWWPMDAVVVKVQ